MQRRRGMDRELARLALDLAFAIDPPRRSTSRARSTRWPRWYATVQPHRRAAPADHRAPGDLEPVRRTSVQRQLVLYVNVAGEVFAGP